MSTNYRQNLDVAWRRIRGQDSAILVTPLDSNVLGLSEVAVRVWELIEEWSTLESIVDVIEAEFEAPREQIADDVRELLAGLCERGFAESREQE